MIRDENSSTSISKTINRIKTRFEVQAEWSNITQIKSSMAAGRHLEKMDMTLYITQPPMDVLLQNLAGRCKMTCR